MCITSMFLLLADKKDGTEIHAAERDALWRDFKKKDPKFYHKVHAQVVSLAATLPGKGGRRMSLHLYHLAQKIWKFN